MAQTFIGTGTYKADHTKFGGLIYLSDFSTDRRGKAGTKNFSKDSSIARRIAQDQRFDIQCGKNMENR